MLSKTHVAEGALTAPRPVSPESSAAAETIARVRAEIHRVVFGQDELVDRLLIGLLTDGHILVEGVPGLAKSLVVTSLASSLDLDSVRIQFTPDLLPADLIGTEVFSPAEGTFTVRKGPVFSNVVLADEINRAPAKVQSALLEAMQERQVSIGGETFPLGDPFLVIATQNPIEQEGTYPLPEAQLDRFMLKVRVDYPDRDDERRILAQALSSDTPKVSAVATAGDIVAARRAVEAVTVDPGLLEYSLQIVLATRRPAAYQLPELRTLISYGGSPRATVALVSAARALAFLRGRPYMVPEDIKAIAHDALRHRIIATYEAEAQELTTDDLLDRILDAVEVP